MLEELKSHNGSVILHNFRPTQKLNNRKIYHMVYKRSGSIFTVASAASSLQTISGGLLLLVITVSFKICFQLTAN